MLQSAVAAPVADDVVRETTTQAFVKDVLEESRRQPVLVDFWAPWCGPCKQLTPVLEKAVRAAKGKAKLVKMNIDEHPAIPGQMGIQSIPAVIAFVNGQPVDGFLGALPESQVTAFLERLVKDRVGGEDKDLLKAADAALAERDTAGAADLYAKILGQDPGNVAALAGLARCYVATGAIEQAKQTLALVPEAKRNEAPVAAARAALELAEQANSLGPIAELEQKVAANPLDHQARYDLALALNAKGRRAYALVEKPLVALLERDVALGGPQARPHLYQIGCVARTTPLAETGDGRYLIELTGICRYRIEEELAVATPYRQCRVAYAPFADDFVARKGEEAVDRKALLDALAAFLKANSLKADWQGIENAPNEALVNALAMMSPYGAAEKQALLEAPDLKTRAEILVAVTEIELAKKTTGGETPLQ